jgi:hypothetical protein
VFTKAVGAFRTSMAGIAPFDVRCMLALICLPLAWKILSLDFTGLGDLCTRPVIFTFYPLWLRDWLVERRCFFFLGDRTRYLQLIAAAFLVCTVLRPSRWLLLPAIGSVWLLDTGAALYRFNFFTIDTPLALLVLVAICPVNLRAAAGWGVHASTNARIVFLACFTYVATYYVLAGLAKLMFDWRWSFVVKIGNYYPISFLWHGQTMPEPIDTIARVSSEAMLAHPWLDTANAMLVLIEQFAWLAAAFSVLVRAHAGLFSAAYHIVVALTTGIMFVTWIPVALAVSLPFSAIRRWFQRKRTMVVASDTPIGRPVASTWVILLAFGVACFPSKGTVVPPFYNYLAFGWRYPALEEMKPIYRIGFRVPESQEIRPLPLHHAGFLDFMHVGYLDVSARYYMEQHENEASRQHFSESIRSLLTVLRPSDANGWLLGKWRAPVHLYSDPGQVEVHTLRRFLLLHGTPVPGIDGRPAGAHWRICGDIDLDEPDTSTMVTLNENCAKS